MPYTRSFFNKQRKALTVQERLKLAKSASLHLPKIRPLLPKNAKIALYQDSFGELPTFGIVAFCLKNGFTPYLPVVQDKKLIFAPIIPKNHGQFPFYHIPKKKHRLGMYEPISNALIYAAQLDACFCPLTALDKKGVRMGMGGGFYDRTLASFQGLKIGWCYDFQLVDNLEVNAWDVTMDIAITPSAITYFQ